VALKAIALNCTLKRSGGEPSSTDKMIGLIAGMRTALTTSLPRCSGRSTTPTGRLPAQAACYWVGEAMHKTDFKDLRQVPENVQALAGILAANAVHLANLLQQEPYPGVAPSR